MLWRVTWAYLEMTGDRLVQAKDIPTAFAMVCEDYPEIMEFSGDVTIVPEIRLLNDAPTPSELEAE